MLSTHHDPSPVVHLAAREPTGFGRGGTTLWRHAGDGFSVIVYQMHDEPEGALSRLDDYDMVEIRVITARSSLGDFWSRGVRRVTHKKWSWALVCMDPDKDYAAIRKDMKGSRFRGSYYTFDEYEGLIDKAEKAAEKAVKELAALRRSVVGSHEPWTKALKLDKGDPNKDKFWAVAVFPDDFHWIVKIDYGMLNNLGRIYPRHWELGYRFDSYSRADAFAKGKLRDQYGKNFVDDSSTETATLLRWSLQAAIADADADGAS